MRTLGGFVLRLLAMPSLARRGHDYTSSPARRGAVVYVDPCTADLYDDRLGMTQEVCTQIGVRFVSVWSKGFASMLCNKPDACGTRAPRLTDRDALARTLLA